MLPLMFGKSLMQNSDVTQDDGGDEVYDLSFQKNPTIFCGECNVHHGAECIAPHTCGGKTVYSTQHMPHVLRKWN